MSCVKRAILIHNRTSFGITVYSKEGADPADIIHIAKCDKCGRWVKMNGPGSDANIFTRAVKALLWTVKRDTQELFTPAADLHDMQCHQGLMDDELEKANKQFRENCLELIRRRYEGPMKDLSRYLRGAPSVTFFQAIFSSKLREVWKLQREMKRLIKERKEKESDAELYYTALKLCSRDVVPKTRCTLRDTSVEEDVFVGKDFEVFW